jgi:hypothetical protein
LNADRRLANAFLRVATMALDSVNDEFDLSARNNNHGGAADKRNSNR